MLIASFTIAVLGYLVMCRETLFKGGYMPISGLLLWGLLDGLAALTGYLSEGNWMLAAGYTAGVCLAITANLVRGHTEIAKSDLWVTGLVAVCVAIWLGVGDTAGLIASSVATFIAGFPALIH